MQYIKTQASHYFNRGKNLVHRHDILLALFCVLCVVVVGLFLGLRNDAMISSRLGSHVHYSFANPLSILAHWDGIDYINIAKYGYRSLLDAGFFPLYPLTIRLFHFVLGSYLISALLISWSSLVGAVYFYIKIMRRLGWLDKTTNVFLAVAPFILFPTAVFMIVTYTEGLFAFLALASIYFALTKRYFLSGAFMAMAGLTHITGAFLIILNGLILIEEKVSLKDVIKTVAVGSLGVLSFMVFSYVRFHNFLEFLKSQTHLHGWLKANYLTLLHNTSYLNILFVALLIASAIYFWKTRKSFAIYALLFLLIPIVGGQWGGFNRYVIMAFPIPLMIYDLLKEKQIYVFAVMLTAIFWTYTLLQYAAGYISS